MLCLFALELDIDINTLNVKALSYFWKDTRLGKGACYSLGILSAYTLQHLHLFLPSGKSGGPVFEPHVCQLLNR